MKKSRRYRATDVKNVSVEAVLAAAPEEAATAGIDISMFEAWTVMRWRDGSFERPWKAKIPSQMDELIAALRRVGQERSLIVAMESTGTYGDALRARLTAAGLEVHRVGGKAAHEAGSLLPPGLGCPLSGSQASFHFFLPGNASKKRTRYPGNEDEPNPDTTGNFRIEPLARDHGMDHRIQISLHQ